MPFRRCNGRIFNLSRPLIAVFRYYLVDIMTIYFVRAREGWLTLFVFEFEMATSLGAKFPL